MVTAVNNRIRDVRAAIWLSTTGEDEEMNGRSWRSPDLRVIHRRHVRRPTYAANRSLAIDPPAADGTVVLDFNRATNLPCASTDHATCPLPPAENRLRITVEAGEKIPYERSTLTAT